MASGKKESEAFNMLKFMYQDDEDDLEDAERGEDEGGHEEEEPQVQTLQSGGEEFELKDLEQQESKGTDAVFPGELQDGTSLQQLDTGTLRFPTPQAEGLAVEPLRSRRERPTIVDYGHDEVAMSPEAEEGEILGNGRFNQDANSANADSQDRALAGDVGIISTPTVHLTPPSVRVENSESDALNDVSKESIMDDLTGANIHEDIDPLDRFLPPPPKAKCPEDLQDKINKFLAYKRQGKSFNAEVRNRKDYRNPDFLLHAVRYQDIDQIGSCFSKDVFDPHGYDARDYYDAIEVDMKLEMERKDQEKKKSPKVEFVTSGTQQAVVLAATRSTMSVSGVPNLPSGGVQSTSVSAHAVSREGRQNKKSKWDKVDDDQKTALGGGQVAQTSVGAHASFMSAANAGSGYAMFVQQKRREAEEKRSSERKVDRRS